MFNENQKFVLQIGIGVVIIFFLGLVFQAEALAAFLWALILGLVFALLMRQNRRVAHGTDIFRDIIDEVQTRGAAAADTMADTAATMREKVEERRSVDKDGTEPTSVAAAPLASFGEMPGEDSSDSAPQNLEKPSGMDSPRDGGPDDLKRISGVGPKLEELLHSHGIYHFDQIASWKQAEIDWIDEKLEGFKGRASRDNWVGQAQQLDAEKNSGS